MLRVFVIENQSLLGAGIENLLLKGGNFEVWGFTPDTVPSLLNAIKQSQPDVIVLDRASHLISAPQLMAVLPDPQHLRLIEVSAASKYLRIFSKHQILIIQQPNLATVINQSTYQFRNLITF